MEEIINWGVALLTLTALEIILGIDNILILSILVEKLPAHKKKQARQLGLFLALIFRILLLTMVSYLSRLTTTLFTILNYAISWRDLILIGGGLFLIYKATVEIYAYIELKEEHREVHQKSKMSTVIAQIIAFDLIFSLDSILTAVGLVQQLSIMIIAVVIAIVLMMIFAEKVGKFIDENPTLKILALAFLAMVGMLLIADGLGNHFDRGYLYFAMGFSVFIELLNRRRGKKQKH